MRYMGLDYGTKTVGVALSDERFILAQPYVTIEREKADKLRRTLAALEEIVKEQNVGRIILGYPKYLNNTEGDRCEATVLFKEKLEKRLGLPVVLWDERLTTVEADRVLDDMGVAGKGHKAYVDKIAASLILQNYLDSLKPEERETT